MSGYQGFWSYVHSDDEDDQGRISQLAKDVVAQYQMRTGETIELFLDKDAIEWGEEWPQKIDDNLASVAFFIPVITPRYFMSSACRRELRAFARRAERPGLEGLLLPLYYVDVPSLEDESVEDDLIRMVRKFQWQDWRELRWKDTTSEEYRRGVDAIVTRLIEANKRAEEVSIAEAAAGVEGEEGDDALGTIDRIAQAEEAWPPLNATIIEIGGWLASIGTLLETAYSDTNPAEGGVRGGFVHQRSVARRLATELSGPTDRISTLSNQFASHLHDVDDGFRAIIEQGAVEVEEKPESKEGFSISSR